MASSCGADSRGGVRRSARAPSVGRVLGLYPPAHPVHRLGMEIFPRSFPDGPTSQTDPKSTRPAFRTAAESDLQLSSNNAHTGDWAACRKPLPAHIFMIFSPGNGPFLAQVVSKGQRIDPPQPDRPLQKGRWQSQNNLGSQRQGPGAHTCARGRRGMSGARPGQV